MAKRTATSELNHDNWNVEDAPEEAGTFRKAGADVMQNRVIKAAKRRSMGTPDNTLGAKSPFAAFGGFKASTNNTSTPTSSFSFLSNTNKTEKSDGSNGKTTETEESQEYYSSLKGLNQSVSQWIKTHVDSNPFCILTPIFKDYEKHLAEIDEKEAKRKGGKASEKPAPSSTTGSATTESKIKPAEESAKKDFQSIFSPMSNTSSSTTTTTSSAPKFNFGSGASSGSNLTAGFIFAGTQPFTFSNVTKQEEKKASEDDGEAEEEEDKPPKAVFKPVVEEGSTYNKRCKVFVKKESAFQERGVGTLYLKPVGEKTQLIVRADTSLGNVILNTLLKEGMPLQRMGANNVMIACIPLPDAEPTPVPVLLRVKTGADADEVLEKIKKCMK